MRSWLVENKAYFARTEQELWKKRLATWGRKSESGKDKLKSSVEGKEKKKGQPCRSGTVCWGVAKELVVECGVRAEGRGDDGRRGGGAAVVRVNHLSSQTGGEKEIGGKRKRNTSRKREGGETTGTCPKCREKREGKKSLRTPRRTENATGGSVRPIKNGAEEAALSGKQGNSLGLQHSAQRAKVSPVKQRRTHYSWFRKRKTGKARGQVFGANAHRRGHF